MDFDFLLLLGLIMCFASFVQGSIGFGFPMIATAFLSLFMDIQTAILFTLIPSIFLNIISIRSEGHFFVAVKQNYGFALFTVIGSAIGTYILLSYDSMVFKLLLAGIIFFYLFFNKFEIQLKFIAQSPKKSLVGFGLLTGIVGGLTNVMAPIFLMYSLEAKHSKAQMIQAGNICFLWAKMVQIVLFGMHGQLGQIQWSFALGILLFVVVFFYAGTKIKKKLNAKLYRNLIKFLLFFIALSLVFKSLYLG